MQNPSAGLRGGKSTNAIRRSCRRRPSRRHTDREKSERGEVLGKRTARLRPIKECGERGFSKIPRLYTSVRPRGPQ